MKNLTEKRKLPLATLVAATVVFAGFQVPKLMAEANLVDQADEVLTTKDSVKMDNIEIDGKLSASEKLRKQREKLENENKAMVEKKIEDIRIKNEIALTNRLKEAFSKSVENLKEDKVQVAQAAPVNNSASLNSSAADTAFLETSLGNVNDSDSAERKLKIIPFFGSSMIKGSNVDFTSNVNAGASLEAQITNRISGGIGASYTTLDATDPANLNSSTYQARRLSYDRLTFEGNSKFFILAESIVRPYVGAALSLNRSNLKYTDTVNTIFGSSISNDTFTTNSLAATAKLGAELNLSKAVGLNLDISYSKSISSSTSSTNNNNNTFIGTNTTDNLRLQSLSQSIEDAGVTSIQGGLVVKF